MSKAHFEVECPFDRTTSQRVSVTIDYDTKEVVMRALNDRTVYTTTLTSMVQSEVEKLCKLKALEGKKPRKLRVNRGYLRP